MANCKNCDHQLSGEEKFCPNCGQKVIERLRLRTLLGELAAAFFAWDSKLFQTLRLLLFKPGEVSKNYIAGKRKSYVAPMRMYLFCSVVFFLLLGIVGLNPQEGGAPNDTGIVMTFDGDSAEIDRDSLLLMDQHNRLDELEEVREQESEFMKHMIKQGIRLLIHGKTFTTLIRSNFSVMVFLLIPLFALMLKISHLKNKLDYIEHLIFGLYFHSFVFFCFSLMIGFTYIMPGDIALYIIGLLIGLHLFFGTKLFYGRNWLRTVTKFIGLITVYLSVTLLLTVITAIITLYYY